MATRKKKRKTRVTKEQIIELREEKKRRKSDKKRIMPGPWTEIETDLEVNVRLKKSTSGIGDILGNPIGNYLRDESWFEPGWHPIVFNIESGDMKNEVAQNGLDYFLAASEKALSNVTNSKGKKQFGTIIILSAVDNSQESEPSERFISCSGKTNKKSIKGFMARRKGKYIKL